MKTALITGAIISICNADFAVRDAMAAGALSAEQAALVTMHRQDDANIQALPHADDNCAEGPIGGASGGLRGFARAGWRVFTRTVVGAVAPRRLYASLVLLDRGGGGESPFFSDFQFALPAKMDYADPAQAARTGAPAAELPAAVKVTDARDNPVRGARVTFTVTAGAGSVGSSQHTVTTGADGVAQVTWTLDAAPTTNVVAAGGRGIATPGHNGPLGRDGEGDVVFDPFWPDFQAGPPIASTPAPLPSAPGPVVEFTARVIEPMLTLVKVVVNDNGGTAGPAHFTLSAAGPTPIAGPGGASSGPGFLAGTYVLGETGPAGYEAGGWSCEGGSQDGNTITLGWTGESATCTIQNDDIPPTLTLIKQVVTDNGGTSSPTDWTLSASGPTPIAGVGGVTSGRSFSAGTYNLSESGPTGYAASPWTCTGGSLSGSLLTLGLGESAVCTITNNDVPPTLTLVKQVTNDDGGTRVPADWTLSAAGPSPISGAGGATSGPTFRTGTYTLSETGPSGYDAGPWTCVGGAQAGNLITLGLGETAVCTIVNDDVAPSPARALLIVGADDSPPQAQLMATGRFTRVDFFDARTSTPSLATLADYDRVLAYTNFIAANPTALGDVLADYVDSGGGLVVSTYAFSTPWSIRGRITTSEYSPLLDVGQNGAVSGVLSPVVPGDPVFAGINLAALSYFHNSNFAHPGLVRGATLLATDGAGRNMIARNSAGTVIGVNLFPGVCCGGNNQEFFNLLANLIQSGR